MKTFMRVREGGSLEANLVFVAIIFRVGGKNKKSLSLTGVIRKTAWYFPFSDVDPYSDEDKRANCSIKPMKVVRGGM